MKYIKIKDHPNLVRDIESNAILNVNVKAKNEFLLKREENRRIKKMLEENENMKNQISDLNEKINLLFKLIPLTRANEEIILKSMENGFPEKN